MQRRTRDNTKPQSQHCGAAPYSLHSRQRRQCTPKTRIPRRSYSSNDSFHFRRPNAHLTHMPTSATLPATITLQTRAHRHTRRDKPRPAQHYVIVMTRVTQHSAHLQATHATSHTRTQHTNTQAAHARTTSRTAETTAHCAIITASTPPHARHTQHGTQLRPPHTPPTENHTQSHTRHLRHTHDSRVRLPSVDGMLPESWLFCKCNALQDTRTAIASHHGTRRRRRPQPAARNASQRIASIKSSQLSWKASQHTACYR